MSNRNNQNDSERFRVRPGAPKQRGDAFINKVLRQTNKAGVKLGKTAGKVGQRPGSRLGRGHVAARFAGRGLGANARRVTIKVRLVNLAQAGPRSTAAHLRYIERGATASARGAAPDEIISHVNDAIVVAIRDKVGRGTECGPPKVVVGNIHAAAVVEIPRSSGGACEAVVGDNW